MEQIIIKSNTPAMSEDIRAIAKALRLAKREFRPTGFDGDNKFQNIKYAKIGAIYKAVEGALDNHGIIICHFKRPNDTGIEYMHTRLIHDETGQFIEDCRVTESEKPGNQAKGAADTYMKKYAVLSLCAIAAEDDDGQEEQKHIDKKPDLLVQDEIDFLHSQLKSCSNGKKLYENILKSNKIHNLSDLPFSRYEEVKSYIVKNKE
jgi:hypothetical protein